MSGMGPKRGQEQVVRVRKARELGVWYSMCSLCDLKMNCRLLMDVELTLGALSLKRWHTMSSVPSRLLLCLDHRQVLWHWLPQRYVPATVTVLTAY